MVSIMSNSVDKRLHKVKQEYYIGLLKIAVVFTGFSFYSITIMQWYLQSVIKYDYSTEVYWLTLLVGTFPKKG